MKIAKLSFLILFSIFASKSIAKECYPLIDRILSRTFTPETTFNSPGKVNKVIYKGKIEDYLKKLSLRVLPYDLVKEKDNIAQIIEFVEPTTKKIVTVFKNKTDDTLGYFFSDELYDIGSKNRKESLISYHLLDDNCKIQYAGESYDSGFDFFANPHHCNPDGTPDQDDVMILVRAAESELCNKPGRFYSNLPDIFPNLEGTVIEIQAKINGIRRLMDFCEEFKDVVVEKHTPTKKEKEIILNATQK